MPDYQFKAMDAGGKVVFGSSSAADHDGLAEILRGQGLFLMEAAANSSQAPAPSGAPLKAGELAPAKRFSFGKKKVKLQEVSFFTTQLSIMLQTGLPILESLELLSSQMKSPQFNAIVHDVADGVSHGRALSAAFRRHPAIFDEVYISLMAAGEASGRLDLMLERLSAYLEFRLSLGRKIQSALLYPVIVMTTAVAVLTFMVTFVLPTFVEVFKELHVELPWPTRVLIATSELLRTYWYVPPIIVLGLWSAHKWAMKKVPAYAKRLDRIYLAVPILGDLVRNIALTRILRTMASLLESGVSILRTLDLAKEAAGNAVFRELLEKVAVDVRDGKLMSVSMSSSAHVPRVVISMIATGEKTGALPTVINRVSQFYEAETDTSIKNLFAALEPIFIVGLGIMVGGIAITVLLPMFDLARGIN